MCSTDPVIQSEHVTVKDRDVGWSPNLKIWKGDDVFQVKMLIIDISTTTAHLAQGPFPVRVVPFMVGWKHILAVLYFSL